MGNAPPVPLVIGKVFFIFGAIGTIMMLTVWLCLPPSHQRLVCSGVFFPAFLLLGSVFWIVGKRGTASTQTLQIRGIATEARPIRILKRFGRHPVSRNSIYALEVALDVDGKSITSRAFFYGEDHLAVESLIAMGRPIKVLYCAEYPGRVLFAGEA